ncbi:MAG: succinate dehydrogenase/fumarate reductase cytochrome b subunit [Rikenellaceae bacterium]
MSNLFTSSIGKKLIMSVTGLFLVLFIIFHMSMNIVAVISADGYNAVCEFLGANWYALAATVILAAGVLVHFIYAFVLTILNRRARGRIRYAVTVNEEGVDWSSKNMLALGLIVVCGLLLHLFNFWSKMQLVEIMGGHTAVLGDGSEVSPTDGVAIIRYTFSQWYYALLYIIWFVALWFHLTHGMWSMMQSAGLNNKIWLKRFKCIANFVSTVILIGFALVVIVFYIQSL